MLDNDPDLLEATQFVPLVRARGPSPAVLGTNGDVFHVVHELGPVHCDQNMLMHDGAAGLGPELEHALDPVICIMVCVMTVDVQNVPLDTSTLTPRRPPYETCERYTRHRTWRETCLASTDGLVHALEGLDAASKRATLEAPGKEGLLDGRQTLARSNTEEVIEEIFSTHVSGPRYDWGTVDSLMAMSTLLSKAIWPSR